MARRLFGLICGIAGLVVMTGRPVTAHHAFSAEFDASKPVTLSGTVTKMEWVNPHVWMHIDVKDAAGQVVTWAIEGGAPNSLFRRGIRKDSLPLGILVKVEGFMAKSGKPVANGRNVTYPDGLQLFFGSSGTGAPTDGRDPGDGRPKP